MFSSAMLQFALAVLLASLAGTFAQSIVLSSPARISNCTENTFTWTGGVAPFQCTVRLFTNSRGFSPKVETVNTRSYSFVSGNDPEITSISFLVSGQNGTGSNEQTIPITYCAPVVAAAPVAPIISEPITTTTTTQPPVSEPISTSNPGVTTVPPTNAAAPVSSGPAVSAGGPSSSPVITASPSAAAAVASASASTASQAGISASSASLSPSSGSSSSQSQSDRVSASTSSSAAVAIDTGSSTSSGPSVNIPAVAGGVAGVVIVILALIGIFLWRRRQRSRGDFSRVDINEPPSSQYYDKPAVSHEAYHVTPYANSAGPPVQPQFVQHGTLAGASTMATVGNPYSNLQPASQYPPEVKDPRGSPVDEMMLGSSAGEASSSQQGNARAPSVSSLEHDDVVETLPPNYEAAMRQSRADLGLGSQVGK